MQNFQDIFETRKQLLISGFSICMTVPLNSFDDVSNHIKQYESQCSHIKQHCV